MSQMALESGGQDHSTKISIASIIDHEFRGLSTDRELTTMSAFDLIDYCSQLFEKLVEQRGTQRGLRRYVRAYLIFSYFITTFIMVHFEGFARFMESSHTDFVIYLNLYEFFRSEKVLGSESFNCDLKEARQAVLKYLAQKDLLTFDPDELFGWLDDYVSYLQNEGDLSEDSGSPQKSLEQTSKDFVLKKYSPEVLPLQEPIESAAYSEDDSSIDEFDTFNERFPEIRATTPHRSTPYPTSPSPRVPLLIDHLEEPLSDVKVPGQALWALHESTKLTPKPSVPPPVPLVPQIETSRDLSCGTREKLAPPQTFLKIKSQTQPNGFSSYSGSIDFHSEKLKMNIPPRPTPTRSFTQADQLNSFHLHKPANNGVPYLRPKQNFGAIQNGNRPAIQPPYATASYQHEGHQSHGSEHHAVATATNRTANSSDHRVSKSQWMQANAVCGLKNLGSSCYINLTIQMLVGLERFNDLFYRRIDSWLTTSKKNTLAESTASLVATFNCNGGSNIAPTKFLKVLARLKPDFNIPNEQQDAQELLLFILDRLHEDLAHRPLKPDKDYISTWDIHVGSNDREKYLEWYRGLIEHEGVSQVNDMCQGHVQHKLNCNKCGYSSISYSPFTILSLPIPHADKGGVDLTDCLRYYTQDEVLSGENAWKCPKCNKSENTKENPMDVVFEQKRGLFRFSKRSKSPSKKAPPALVTNASAISIKQLSFIKLPPVLFIHLSRFHMFNLTDKLDTDIAYPLRLLFNRLDHEISYTLRGLVNHYGNLNGGHYTSIVKKSPQKATDDRSPLVWCSFDDDHVRINVPYGNPGMSANKVHSRDVYVLCYERV